MVRQQHEELQIQKIEIEAAKADMTGKQRQIDVLQQEIHVQEKVIYRINDFVAS